MAGMGRSINFAFALCFLVFNLTYGEYLLTTPREVTFGSSTQFCVFVTDPEAPAGNIKVTLNEDRFGFSEDVEQEKVVIDKTINVPAGRAEFCEEIPLGKGEYHRGRYNITGSLSGKSINHTGNVRLRSSATERIFIQTDKHLYQPGQNVQFRILTLLGPTVNVSTLNYPEVWVETPSRTRIQQWLDVNNTAGLVHLSMQLVDEPEEGYYQIHLRTANGNTKNQDFRVGEYVLPRFEVKITPPSYVLATDSGFNFTVCAKYTFGQPVKGTVNLTIDNTQSRLCKVVINKTEEISGCKTFEFTNSEMQVTDCNVYNINVRADFEEEGTGVSQGGSNSISITRSAINFKEIYADPYMKPNLPMTVKVRAEYPDNTPASGVPVEVCAAGKCSNMTTAADGLFTAVMPNYKTNRIFMQSLNCRADLQGSSYSKYVEHFYSPSNSSLLIYAPEDKLKCIPGKPVEHTLPVLFSATNQTSAIVTVQVISRGQIQLTETKEYAMTASDLPIDTENLIEPLPASPKDTVRGVINIPLSLPSSASPSAKVLVWYAREDGEVVSDTRELLVEKCLRNTANLTWAASKLQPGDETTVTVSSNPNSICSRGVVDKSTQLLSQQSDPISLDNIFSFVEDFNIYPWSYSQINDYDYCRRVDDNELAADSIIRRPYNYYSQYVDSLKMFDDSGLYVFSDLKIETRPCEKEEQRYFSTFGGGGFGGVPAAGVGFAGDSIAPEAAPVPIAARPQPSFGVVQGSANKEGAGGNAEPEETDAPRTDFPETWLWDLVVVPSSGVLEEKVTLPDTVTEWVGKAVCAHPQDGVGLSQEKSITTFLPFFIDLTLPPSIKRGEILPVKISVFNYLQSDLPVTVRLEESPEYEILKEGEGKDLAGQRTSCLLSQDKDVHTIRINALSLGDVNLTITAYVDHENSVSCGSGDKTITRRDTIIKPIKVEAEGYLRENTWTKYICTKDVESGEDSLEVWQVAPPAVVVEGSVRGWVNAVGDLLALSLENLGNLIRMPYGCGEQNMLNFAPNIFIMKYLEATKQNTEASKEKLTRFMRTGYRRELLYRRSDGSYSAFGNADDSGSTWLTAFVLKSFAQAQPYILVDKESLNGTRTWLQNQQDKAGCFLSIGKVFHKGMKGGISEGNSSVPLTTYVLISMLEAGEDPASTSVSAAKRCVVADKSQDPYVMAMKAYAYALAKMPEAKQTVDELLKLATVTKNATFWDLPQSPSKSNAVELETAAYAILAMTELDFESYEPQLRKIVKWISAQRNGQGGFYSTQDTVMALQALARFETFTYQGPLNVKASVTAKDLTHSFTVTDTNKLLQQMVDLPAFPTNITLGIEGQGCAVLQAVLRYNIPEPEASDAFDLTVNSRTEYDRKCLRKRLTACASYRLEDKKSNMAVIEVNLVSGYIPEKEDLKAAVKDNPSVVKRYEVDGSKVSFYIEELTPEATCVNFRIIREVDVENVKPGTVVVYDYYQPEFSISESYTLPPPEECRQ